MTLEQAKVPKTFHAYYYCFTATGNPAIDAILQAVAYAGKGAHHTRDWNDLGYIERIQKAADIGARRRITVSELQTAAKAMHEASAACFGWRRGDWDNVDDEVKKHRLFEAKAAFSSIGIEVEE